MVGAAGDLNIYLSAHLDDAVLSCGGRIWQQIQEGESVMVVTIFAGIPDVSQPPSPFVNELHQRWGAISDAVAKRKSEDREALVLLGAEAIHWEYSDCIYRREPDGSHAYPDEDALWGPMAPSDLALLLDLRDRIAGLPAEELTALYIPMAVGRHVDHRIIRKAAEQSGRALSYYEDFPYARDAKALEEAKTGDVWKAEIVPLSQRALESRIAASACYRSQISTFWEGRDDLSKSVRAYAQRVGGGHPAERYWQVSQP